MISSVDGDKFLNRRMSSKIFRVLCNESKFLVNTISYSNITIYIYIYTGCHRRKGPNFGRVFLKLNYTDITQNTYIQS